MNVSNEAVISSQFGYLILKDNPLHDFLYKYIHIYDSETRNSKLAYSIVCLFIFNLLEPEKIEKFQMRGSRHKTFDTFFYGEENMLGERLWDFFDKEEIKRLSSIFPVEIYNTKKYYRES